jgi:hypothetical protein
MRKIKDSFRGKRTKKKRIGALEQGRVRVRDVLLLPSHENLEGDVVRAIAESFPLSGGGPINSITIRRVREQEDGVEVTKSVLIAGAHRLEAARLAVIRYFPTFGSSCLALAMSASPPVASPICFFARPRL